MRGGDLKFYEILIYLMVLVILAVGLAMAKIEVDNKKEDKH